jgi:hypothetical protein
MQSASFSERQSRNHYRHELRNLTYVILEEANGGIVRNLSHDGVGIQAVGALRAQQRIRMRFDLSSPRLRIDACGEVSWANPLGQCGIRFVDLPERTRHQIKQWVFSNLLDAAAPEAVHRQPMFESCVSPILDQIHPAEEQGELILSENPRPAIPTETNSVSQGEAHTLHSYNDAEPEDPSGEFLPALDWLFRPLPARTVGWLVDGLVVTAALLLFGVIFLSIAHELPQWPLTVSGIVGAAAFVVAAYWMLFAVFGAQSLGARLARNSTDLEPRNEGDTAGRFR